MGNFVGTLCLSLRDFNLWPSVVTDRRRVFVNGQLRRRKCVSNDEGSIITS